MFVALYKLCEDVVVGLLLKNPVGCMEKVKGSSSWLRKRIKSVSF